MSVAREGRLMPARTKGRGRPMVRFATAVDLRGDEALDAVESASLAAIELTRKVIARLHAM